MHLTAFTLASLLALGCTSVSADLGTGYKLANVGEYLPLPTAADKLSWDYNNSHVGLDGVCSEKFKCGPTAWSKV